MQADFALDDGTNSVCADHDVGLRSSSVRERKMDPVAVFLELDAPMIELDCSFRQCGKQQVQELSTMNVVPLTTILRERRRCRPRGGVIASPCDVRSVMPLIGEPIFRS